MLFALPCARFEAGIGYQAPIVPGSRDSVLVSLLRPAGAGIRP